MRRSILLTVCLMISLLTGCEKEPGVGEVVSTFNNYEETGDLPALQEHGFIRLLAPRFDEPSGLPREEFPPENTRRRLRNLSGTWGWSPAGFMQTASRSWVS